MLASIWLLPQAAQQRALQSVIDDLSEMHGTVRFAPHLTACGSLRDMDMLDAASAHIRRSGLLPLTVAPTGIASGTASPFRAVFIEIADSPALQVFRERLREIAGAGELHPPHISLLYTLDRQTQRVMPNLDAARLRAIAAGCRERVPPGGLILDRAVVKTAEGSWDNVRSWALARTL